MLILEAIHRMCGLEDGLSRDTLDNGLLETARLLVAATEWSERARSYSKVSLRSQPSFLP